MRNRQRNRQGRGALDLIEEATHLLRTAPWSVLALYYIGAFPFVLGLLFFVADMSRNPFARQHVVEASGGMAILFLWMKFWQVIFVRSARSFFTGDTPPPLTIRDCWRIVAAQTTFHPLGLVLLPVSLVLTVPFAWVYSFFQNITALDDGGGQGFNRLFRRALRQCVRWPAENHAIKLIMFLFALFVFLNWTILCVALPSLIQFVLGVESVFSRSPMAMLNTTFFASMFGLTYLCVDPILKLIQALRCFYGEALTDGADLRAELRPYTVAGTNIAVGLVGWLALTTALPVMAAESPSPLPISPPPSSVTPAELDQAINEVVQQRKYVWRLPREKVLAENQPNEEGVIANFVKSVIEMITEVASSVAKTLAGWLDGLIRRIFGGWRPRGISPDTGFSWILLQNLLLLLLLVVVVVAVIILAYKAWRARYPKAAVVVAGPLAPLPDLAGEDVSADQMPEDGWTRLARELLERGEFRLALRALYLASLAHLAKRHLITLARFKSNREYEQELQRRGHALSGLMGPFAENLMAFERIWYGTHTANHDTVAQFSSNVERIKSIA